MNPSRRRALAISWSVAIAALGVLGTAPAGAESGSGGEQWRDPTGEARAGAERRVADRAVDSAPARHRNGDCQHHWPHRGYWPVRGPLVGGSDGFGAFALAALAGAGRAPSATMPAISGGSEHALAGLPVAPPPAAAPPSAPLGGPMPPGPPPPPPPPPPQAAAPPPAVEPALKPVAAQPDPPRIGYPDYLREATVAQIAALALAGAAGLGALTGAGGVVGYRQAKAGFALRAAGTARFLS